MGVSAGAETEAEALGEHCLLACPSGFVQPAFIQNPGPTSPECHHPQWTRSFHINHQRRYWTKGPPTGRAFSLKGPSSKMTLTCVELTANQTAHWTSPIPIYPASFFVAPEPRPKDRLAVSLWPLKLNSREFQRISLQRCPVLAIGTRHDKCLS